jgi:hypothetical protein
MIPTNAVIFQHNSWNLSRLLAFSNLMWSTLTSMSWLLLVSNWKLSISIRFSFSVSKVSLVSFNSFIFCSSLNAKLMTLTWVGFKQIVESFNIWEKQYELRRIRKMNNRNLWGVIIVIDYSYFLGHIVFNYRYRIRNRLQRIEPFTKLFHSCIIICNLMGFIVWVD